MKGRPKLAPGLKKEKTYRVKLSAVEQLALENRMASFGFDKAGPFFRSAALGQLKGGPNA